MKPDDKAETPHPTPLRAKPRLSCKSCFGSGRIDDGEIYRDCDDCGGRGYYYARPKLQGHLAGQKRRASSK